MWPGGAHFNTVYYGTQVAETQGTEGSMGFYAGW